MAEEKKIIKRDNWVSSFSLTGRAKINDYTFKIDEHSEKSNWVYNSMNLGVDCGEKHGTIYTNMIGGYNAEGGSIIYAHGKDENGNDDYNTPIQVQWDSRKEPDVLEEIGEQSFIVIGIEMATNGKPFYEKFLSAYDAIQYMQEYLKDGMVINVRGTLRYQTYNGTTTVQKNVTRIILSDTEEKDFKATFTQSILIDTDSASLKNIDKDKGVMLVNGRVLDYVKDIDGIEVKGQYPFYRTFEFPMPLIDPEKCKKIMNLFKVKKNTVTQITFLGDLIEMGGKTTATLDDIPEDIKQLIEWGVYTEEQAIEACSTNGNREQRMVITRPYVRNIKNGDETTSVLQIFPEKYTENDLILDYVVEAKAKAEALGDDVDDSNTESADVDDDEYDWLSQI